jgi:hypothetical protein
LGGQEKHPKDSEYPHSVARKQRAERLKCPIIKPKAQKVAFNKSEIMRKK